MPSRLARSAAVYALLAGAPLAGLVWVLQQSPQAAGPVSVTGGPLPHSPPAPMPNLTVLIIQLIVILAAARVTGWLFRRLHQPQVVGEMAAGLLLGPTVLGAVAPGAFEAIFPTLSLGYLNALSQLGLLLFMFLVGLEFDPKLLRGHGQVALTTSHASIILPFLLGVLLALALYPEYGPAGVQFRSFALFMGAAMSVTAFPVLARILMERKLLHSRVGVIALAAAAVDDVTAWCMLAVVIVVARAERGVAIWLTLGGTVVFAAVMLMVVRPIMRAAFARRRNPEEHSNDLLAAVLLLALSAALVTEWIGIHALFGAFMAGAIIPRQRAFVPELIRRLEDLTVVFLLPLFFAFTGLRTTFNFGQTDLWFTLLIVTAVAVAGKLLGSALAARLSGMTGREALAVGTLLNTRGLMELVILNIGLDIGIVSPALFSVMAAMALITTVMTVPILHLIKPQAGVPG